MLIYRNLITDYYFDQMFTIIADVPRRPHHVHLQQAQFMWGLTLLHNKTWECFSGSGGEKLWRRHHRSGSAPFHRCPGSESWKFRIRGQSLLSLIAAPSAPDWICSVSVSLSGLVQAVQQCGMERQISKQRQCWLWNKWHIRVLESRLSAGGWFGL